MGEGSGHSDNAPRPDDKTVIGNDATVTDGGGGSGVSIPREIGPYKVKRPIGAGGMGTVVLAQQESPRRDVAIKIMNPGVVSRKALRRFEFEAQTLGRLQHPAIAQVYEAGMFDDGSGGRPYFAMEYVSSAKELGDYVTDKNLDTVARLELFRAFCEGVEYGHRRGVIHRDLKPGNILVDAEGHPKIIDFGVARSTESDSVTATLATEAGQLIGTLQYMSPEQVELDPGDLDTRSDVYALGVILYQLLVDKLPYDLTGASLTKAGELIKDMLPARLSEINTNLKGDLETICLKALEKDRDQRYQSVGDLSDDIRRYLADEPIMARPPTRAEQFRRLVRKNKAAAVATGVVAAALVVATTISIVFAVEASRQRDQASRQRDVAELAKKEADAQRKLAEEKTAQVEKQAEEMEVMLNFQAQQLSGIDVPAMGASLKDRMLAQFEVDADAPVNVDFTGSSLGLLNEHIFTPTLGQINDQFADQPLVQARLLQTMASTLRKLGLLEEAASPQARALELRINQLGTQDPATLASMNDMGKMLLDLGRYEEAMPYGLQALESRRRILGDEHPDTLSSITDMGDLLIRQGKYDDAMPFCLEALGTYRRTLGDEHPSTIAAMADMGGLLSDKGKYEKAMEYYVEALDVSRRTIGSEHPDTLLLINDIGVILYLQGKYDKAMPYYSESLETSRRILGNEHPATIGSISNMGSLLLKLGKNEEALRYFTESLEASRLVLGDEHPDTLYEIYVMGGILVDEGKYDEAKEYYTEALEARRRILGDEHPETLTSISDMGMLFHIQGMYDEAMPYYIEALETSRRTLGDDHPDTITSMGNMSMLLLNQGKYSEAMKYYNNALEAGHDTTSDVEP